METVKILEKPAMIHWDYDEEAEDIESITERLIRLASIVILQRNFTPLSFRSFATLRINSARSEESRDGQDVLRKRDSSSSSLALAQDKPQNDKISLMWAYGWPLEKLGWEVVRYAHGKLFCPEEV